MRVAIAGKGGSGKTTISGTVARLLGRKGRRVVAIDGDTNPNLAETLGVQSNGNGEITALPSDLLVRREDAEGNAYTELVVPVEEVIARYGISAPDGVQLLVMGQIEHAGKGCKCRAHAIARNVIGDLLQYNVGAAGDVVVDMEAGLEHLSRGTTKHVDALLAVAEPYYRSLETARRACELATELGISRVAVVANKVRDEQEAEAIRSYLERHGLQLAAEVPFDETVMEADRVAGGLLDVAGSDAPAVRALDRLADSLVAAGAESRTA